MTHTLKKILIATTVVAFTACGGGGDSGGSTSGGGAAAGTNIPNAGMRLKSYTDTSDDNYEGKTLFEYDGNKVIKAKTTEKYDGHPGKTYIWTWEYKDNQEVKHIFEQYDKNEKLIMTTTSITSYNKQKQPYKHVTTSSGTMTDYSIETTEEVLKWQGRYPVELKMSMSINNGEPGEYITYAKIDNNRIESKERNDTVLVETYTYDAQDRRDPYLYLLRGDTEKFGEYKMHHQNFLITKIATTNKETGEKKEETKSYEFNELGLVVKETIKKGIHTYEYEKF